MDGNTTLVFTVLKGEPNTFLSCQETVSKLYEKYGIVLSYNTVKSCLLCLEQLKKEEIKTRIERRHNTCVPVRVFVYINEKK